jgi:hypothetical protein
MLPNLANFSPNRYAPAYPNLRYSNGEGRRIV